MKYLAQLLLLIAFIPQAEANSQLPLTLDGYTYTQQDARQFVIMAEYIAGAEFTAQEKKDVIDFAIEDFKVSPHGAYKYFYQYLPSWINTILSRKDPFFRVRLGLYIYKDITFPAHLKSHPGYVYKVIERYNLPKNEILAYNQYLFDVFYYTYTQRNYYFNQVLNTYKQSSQLIIDSIKDMSYTQNIWLAGGEIISDYNNVITYRDANGYRQTLYK